MTGELDVDLRSNIAGSKALVIAIRNAFERQGSVGIMKMNGAWAHEQPSASIDEALGPTCVRVLGQISTRRLGKT